MSVFRVREIKMHGKLSVGGFLLCLFLLACGLFPIAAKAQNDLTKYQNLVFQTWGKGFVISRIKELKLTKFIQEGKAQYLDGDLIVVKGLTPSKYSPKARRAAKTMRVWLDLWERRVSDPFADSNPDLPDLRQRVSKEDLNNFEAMPLLGALFYEDWSFRAWQKNKTVVLAQLEKEFGLSPGLLILDDDQVVQGFLGEVDPQVYIFFKAYDL